MTVLQWWTQLVSVPVWPLDKVTPRVTSFLGEVQLATQTLTTSMLAPPPISLTEPEMALSLVWPPPNLGNTPQSLRWNRSWVAWALVCIPMGLGLGVTSLSPQLGIQVGSTFVYKDRLVPFPL